MNKITLIIVVLSFLFSNGLYAQSFVQTGKASFYANKFENKTTASGEKYQHSLLTAAHKTLPFGTIVKITNISNGKTVTVKINDRGPFVEDRIIDVSKSAAVELDFVNEGITEVRIETVENQETIDSRAEIRRKICQLLILIPRMVLVSSTQHYLLKKGLFRNKERSCTTGFNSILSIKCRKNYTQGIWCSNSQLSRVG